MKTNYLQALAILLVTPAHAQTYTTLDDPLGTRTEALGISGGSIVGLYADASKAYGFLDTAGTFTTLDYSTFATIAYGVSGNTVVGLIYEPGSSTYYNALFYDGTHHTYLRDPDSATQTSAQGIDGNTIVGYYRDALGVTHGFLNTGAAIRDGTVYDGTWTILDDPLGPGSTTLNGISGNNIVGVSQTRSFLYDGASWTTISDALGVNGTFAKGISGNNIVGYYRDSENVTHGFLFNGSTYITLDDPLGIGTVACGVFTDKVVGYYYDTSGNEHGFVATVPEPTITSLTACGTLALALRGRKRRTIKAQPRPHRLAPNTGPSFCSPSTSSLISGLQFDEPQPSPSQDCRTLGTMPRE